MVHGLDYYREADLSTFMRFGLVVVALLAMATIYLYRHALIEIRAGDPQALQSEPLKHTGPLPRRPSVMPIDSIEDRIRAWQSQPSEPPAPPAAY